MEMLPIIFKLIKHNLALNKRTAFVKKGCRDEFYAFLVLDEGIRGWYEAVIAQKKLDSIYFS